MVSNQYYLSLKDQADNILANMALDTWFQLDSILQPRMCSQSLLPRDSLAQVSWTHRRNSRLHRTGHLALPVRTASSIYLRSILCSLPRLRYPHQLRKYRLGKELGTRRSLGSNIL